MAEARGNLQEAAEQFFETASEAEIKQRSHSGVCVTRSAESATSMEFWFSDIGDGGNRAFAGSSRTGRLK